MILAKKQEWDLIFRQLKELRQQLMKTQGLNVILSEALAKIMAHGGKFTNKDQPECEHCRQKRHIAADALLSCMEKIKEELNRRLKDDERSRE